MRKFGPWDQSRKDARAAKNAARLCVDCGTNIGFRGKGAKLCMACANVRTSYAANRKVRQAISRKRNNKPERIAYMKAYRTANPRDRSEYKKEYDKANQAKQMEYRRNNSAENAKKSTIRRLKKYGVAENDALRLVEQSTCDCCGVVAVAVHSRMKRALYVDHDHATGKFRGMICCHCNCMIGYSKENAQRLRAGAAYVETHKNILALDFDQHVQDRDAAASKPEVPAR